MIHQRSVPWFIVASIVVAAFPVFAEEKPDAKKEAKKSAEAPVHEVNAERFKSTVKLKATFESPRLKEIIVKPEEWKELTVRKVVPHGKRVKKGEVILAFETKALKEKIAESKASQRTEQLTLQQSADELQHLERSTPLTLSAASTTRREAQEALAYFESVQLEQSRESAKRMLESAKFGLEYAQEELNQLEKMYEEDNLTEETEEIVLKRTRRGVENAKRSVAMRKVSTERALKTVIPRQHKELKVAAETAVLEHKLARASLPRTLEIKKRELEKAKKAHKKSSQAFSKLKKDMEKMTVKAPMDGYVFYGAYVDGKWATAAAVAKKLLPGGSVAPKERILTIAQADGLRLRALVPENQLGMLIKGKKGVAVPVAFPGERLPAKLTALSMIGYSGGYPAEITVKSALKQLTPGMHAEVSFSVFESEDAITVPNAAVYQDGDGHHVMLVKDGEKDERREVTVGFTDGKKTVINRGLSGGDKVRAD